MTALTHKQLGLKLAVENADSFGLIKKGKVKKKKLTGLFSLADQFAAYLDGTDPQPTQNPEETAVNTAPTPTADDAVQAILQGIEGNREALGTQVANLAAQQVGTLRRQGSAQDVYTTALRTIDTNVNQVGRGAADTLREIVRTAQQAR